MYSTYVSQLNKRCYDYEGLCNSCNMGMRDLPDIMPEASRVHMLQVICNISGTLKICPNLMLIFQPLYIVTGTRYDCGALFHHYPGFTTKLQDL